MMLILMKILNSHVKYAQKVNKIVNIIKDKGKKKLLTSKTRSQKNKLTDYF